MLERIDLADWERSADQHHVPEEVQAAKCEHRRCACETESSDDAANASPFRTESRGIGRVSFHDRTSHKTPLRFSGGAQRRPLQARVSLPCVFFCNTCDVTAKARRARLSFRSASSLAMSGAMPP
jgi:hypothetical protein